MIHLYVLLVDDDPEIREIVSAALASDRFFVVRTCTCGSDALRMAIEWRPDLILLDTTMPDMNGAAVLRRLRADRRTAPIPVVFLATGLRARNRAHLRRHGGSGVLAKPLDPRALAAELRRFVPVEGVLSPARDDFFQRLKADAHALSACRPWLTHTEPETALKRINHIAHGLAGAGGTYGFAGITCQSAALEDAAQGHLAGRSQPAEVQRALDQLLKRIGAPG